MVTLEDINVSLASVTRIGNWMLKIDVLLKVAISLATLVYIILKIKQQLRNEKD